MRRQLTLFVPAPAAAPLEALRRTVDPVQHGLIAAHVTLCREDELDALEAVRERLRAHRAGPIDLAFGPVEVFHGHGLLLPCVGGREAYRALRKAVLDVAEPRDSSPHVTLAHPRNPRAPGNALLATPGLPRALSVRFQAVHLVEQVDGGPWRELEQFAL